MEKMDVLEMLREAEDIYVIYSACTNMPFVYCDPETYDDEVILFDSEEEAKKTGRQNVGCQNSGKTCKCEEGTQTGIFHRSVSDGSKLYSGLYR